MSRLDPANPRNKRDTLAQLRARGLGPYLTIDLMPQGGYKETVDADEISISELREMVRQQLAHRPTATRSGENQHREHDQTIDLELPLTFIHR